MDYSEDEKKAMRMVEDYFMMMEGMVSSKKGDVPSQDREEMITFLKEGGKNSQMIHNLHFWVEGYELLRRKVYELSDSKRGLERQLCDLLGED